LGRENLAAQRSKCGDGGLAQPPLMITYVAAPTNYKKRSFKQFGTTALLGGTLEYSGYPTPHQKNGSNHLLT